MGFVANFIRFPAV